MTRSKMSLGELSGLGVGGGRLVCATTGEREQKQSERREKRVNF